VTGVTSLCHAQTSVPVTVDIPDIDYTGMGSVQDKYRPGRKECEAVDRARSRMELIEYSERSQEEQEESDRRRDEAFERYHDVEFWQDYREGKI